jgi:ABC-type oligopeptide transport system substrate-binding subunit/ABC-type branched-subunit amino acid transport system substrate-binding protein
MKKTVQGFLILMLAMRCVSACGPLKSPSEKRAQRAAQAQGDIVIGVVDTSLNPTLFLEGVELAIEELNQRGGVLGRKIKPLIEDDQGDVQKGQQIARKLAKNLDVVAVIGHRYSSVAIPVSIIYERNGILFMSPGATHPNLTRYGGEYTFRNIPSDEEIGLQAAELAQRYNIKKGVVFYERDDAARRLAEIFKAQADKLGIETVTTRSYFAEWQTDFRGVLAEIKKLYEFDGVFIAGRLPTAGLLIKQARDMGYEVPFLGGDGLDSLQLWTVAGRAAEGTVVATVFDPQQPTRLTMEFVSRFSTKYGVPPDTWAAQGYDAIQVIAAAMEKGGSTVPIVVSTTLRFLEKWEGVTGSYTFTKYGDISGKQIFFKMAHNGSFEFLKREAEIKLTIDPLHPIEEITLRLPLAQPVEVIDPGCIESTSSAEVIKQLFLGLTDVDPKTSVAVPELATHWTANTDSTVYTFYLRQNVTWTDGTPVTAHDVVWTVQHNLQPGRKCPYVSTMYIVKNARAFNLGELKDPSALGVRALDDYTVEFTLEQAAVFFPVIVSMEMFDPLPRTVIEAYGDAWTDPTHIQTDGAYRLVFWDKSRLIILQRNPSYYDTSRVAIPEVRYYIIPKMEVGLAMYEQNELDVMGSSYLTIPPAALSKVKTDPILAKEYSNEPVGCTYAYGFNTRRSPVDNPLVRKAIVAAIDRQLIIDLITKGDQKPATTFTPPPIFGSVDPREKIGISFNLVQARKWLAEAGYPEGNNLPEMVLLCNDAEIDVAIAQAVQLLLKYYLNIQIKLQIEAWPDFLETQKQPNTPHIFRDGWCGDYPDAHNFLNDTFHPVNSANTIGWNNTEFATLIEDAMRTPDPETRKALYKRAERILCEEEAAIIPLYFHTAPTLHKSRIKGWYHTVVGGQHVQDWALQP